MSVPATVLRPGALAGRTVALAGAGTAGLAGPLRGLGAQVHRIDSAAIDSAVDGAAVDGAAGALEAGVDLLVASLWPADDRGAPLVDVVTAAFAVATRFRPALAHRRGGVAFLLAPPADLPGGEPDAAAARASVRSLTRSLAREWAADGIRLNCLLLGPGSGGPAGSASPVAAYADLVGWLAAPAGGMLTGQVLDLRPPSGRTV